MARDGAVIENPVTGERIEFRRTQASTDGELLEFEYSLDPGGHAVVGHVHPNQEERGEVLAGALDLRVDGEHRTVSEGEEFVVPPSTPHRVWNDGDEPVRVGIELRPALDVESFFETQFGLARDGKTDGEGRPSPLQFAVLADEFSEELRVSWLPPRLQPPLLGALAGLGRRAGYRARYPEYGSERG